MSNPTITWTPERLRRFKAAYKVAASTAERYPALDVFQFEGHDFLVDYAKYLIQYLEGRFAEAERDPFGERNN